MISVNHIDDIKSLLRDNYRQTVRIQFVNDEKIIELTEADVVQGTFKWDRYCATGDMLEIGSAVSAEVEFTLRNKGYFNDTGGGQVSVDDISFEGKELTIEIGVSKWNARRWENAQVYWLPIGRFTIMSMPHKFSAIRINALDRMTWFDMYVVQDGSNPFNRLETLASLIAKMCTALNMQYTLPNDLPNLDLVVDTEKLIEEVPQLTFRTVVQWVAALTGTCAYINVSGDLVFRWLERAQGITILPRDRFSSTVYEPVVFAGLTVEKNDESLSVGGNSYYRYSIANNSLIQGDDWISSYTDAVNRLWDKLAVTSQPYRPFSATTVPMPYLEPMDVVSYEDNNGEVFDTLITHITYELNGSTSISAVGESQTEATCVSSGGSTSRESADIKALKNKIAYLENASAAARDRLSSMFRIALGLHTIEVVGQDGGTVYYFTTADVSGDNPTLADLSAAVKPNDVIYTFSGAGWAWCIGSRWDKQSHTPVNGEWSYGIARDGSAVLGLINTSGIHVNDDNSTDHTEITPDRYAVYNGSNLVFGFNGQLESQINRLLVKSNIEDPSLDNNAYIRLGNAMLIPADDGLDIVYVEDI